MSSTVTGAASAAPGLAELAEQIRGELDAIEGDSRSALAHAITAGEKLHQAKPQLGHGQWKPWLEENFPDSYRTAAVYMRLAANVQHAAHLGSIREALAALPKKAKDSSSTPSDEQRDYGNNHWENDDVIAWVARRMKAGKTRDEIFEESKAGTHDWPLPGRWLPKNTVDTCRAIVRDRKRRGDTTRRREPRESGKRLRELHAEKRAGRTGDLWHLQVEVMKAVGTLEIFELPELEWSEDNEALVVQIYDDLERHARWNDAALDAVTAHMDELGRQRKIKTLRDRADDPSSTPNERATAARLADKLERRRNAERLGA